jgi:hypothetical protein
MIALARKSQHYKKWTKKDLAFLKTKQARALIDTGDYDKLAEILCCSRRAISSYLYRHGLILYPLKLRRPRAEEFFESRPNFEPTSAYPGSSDKIEVLRQRVALGSPLWHPDDVIDRVPSDAYPPL